MLRYYLEIGSFICIQSLQPFLIQNLGSCYWDVLRKASDRMLKFRNKQTMCKQGEAYPSTYVCQDGVVLFQNFGVLFPQWRILRVQLVHVPCNPQHRDNLDYHNMAGRDGLRSPRCVFRYSQSPTVFVSNTLFMRSSDRSTTLGCVAGGAVELLESSLYIYLYSAFVQIFFK